MNWQAACSPFPWDGSGLLLTHKPHREGLEVQWIPLKEVCTKLKFIIWQKCTWQHTSTMQEVFNSFLCLFFFYFPRGFSERWVCTAVSLLSATGADPRESLLQLLGESFESFRAALSLQRSCLPAWKSLLLSKTSWGRRICWERIEPGAAWVL